MKKIGKIICAVICAAILAAVPDAAHAEGGSEKPQTLSAKSCVLTECTTGQILYAENADERMPVASVTKLMCLLIWAEEIKAGRLSFSDTVTCTAHANSMDGSVIWLETGEELSAAELIKSVVIASANDACAALCEHIAGTEEAFVSLMNDRAEELGLKNTHYVNCVGYDAPDQYSSAYDTAVIAAALCEYDYYDEFFSTRLDYVREGERTTQLLNTNKLINRYEGMTGGKTGTTDAAGCCFAAWAKRDNMTLCAVALSCNEGDDRFDACENLLNYGFDGFEMFKVRADTEKLSPIPVENGIEKQAEIRVKRLSNVIIPKGASKNVEYEYDIADRLTAPIYCGDNTGTLTARLYDEVIFSGEIVTVRDIEELTFFKALQIILCSIFSI